MITEHLILGANKSPEIVQFWKNRRIFYLGFFFRLTLQRGLQLRWTNHAQYASLGKCLDHDARNTVYITDWEGCFQNGVGIMDIIKLTPEDVSELTLLKLSREIAKDIQPIETILERHGIDLELWDQISKLPRFQALLQSQAEMWNSASNTPERVKVKSLSFIEEVLPELYERAHDPREPLSSKVELVKTIGRFAGVGAAESGGNGGEKLSVTINLGADSQLTFEKDITPQVIEGSE